VLVSAVFEAGVYTAERANVMYFVFYDLVRQVRVYCAVSRGNQHFVECRKLEERPFDEGLVSMPQKSFILPIGAGIFPASQDCRA